MFSGIAVVVLSVSMLVPTAAAAPVMPQQAGTTANPAAASPDTRAIDLDFPGGTPAELFEAIEKQARVVANVMVSEDARQFRLPSMHLRGVELQELIDGLAGLGSSDGTRLVSNRIGQTAWTLQMIRTGPSMPARQVTTVFDVMQILSERLTIDDIVTAIQTAAAMQSGGETLKIKYHQETHLLLVTGTDNDLHIADQVVAAMKARGHSMSDEAAIKKTLSNLQAAVTRLKDEVAQLRSRIEKGRESRCP